MPNLNGNVSPTGNIVVSSDSFTVTAVSSNVFNRVSNEVILLAVYIWLTSVPFWLTTVIIPSIPESFKDNESDEISASANIGVDI